MKIEAPVWKFGNDVNTDLIIPARYLNVSDADELAKYCFSDLRPEFSEMVSNGDIIVAGENFGSGSSREHAPLAIKASGIKAVIAESFARIFYRNAFNIGLPLVESKEAVMSIAEGDDVSIDLSTGSITSLTNGKVFGFKAMPEFITLLVKSGGLIEYIRKKR